jgi:hypothetical protein
MAGINEFQAFATAPGANVLAPATYAALPAVATGFMDGIAITEQLNTVWRQSSFIAAAVAQIVANGGLNALDDGNVAGFTSNFLAALAAQLPVAVDVKSFNTRTGAVTLTSADVTTALGYAPASSTAVVSSFNTRTGAVTLTSADVTAALTYVPVAPGAYTSSGLTMSTGRLLGRSTAATGAAEEIVVGTGLSLSAGTLTATGGGGGGATAWAIKTAAYTAVSGDRLAADTSGGVFTVTLPATPTAGNYVEFADGGGAFGVNNLTISRNGSTIMGLSEDMTLSTNNSSVGLVYNGTTWRIY